MKAIFLSASIPDLRRDPKYHESSDPVAIRDAVRALISVALPHARLVWGGHPAITPLVRVVAQSIGITNADHIRLFQSAWHSAAFPADNVVFEQVVVVPAANDLESSLERMRREMIESEKFEAAIFIGGMEGVEREFSLFRNIHPLGKVFPIASTGGAARFIFGREMVRLDLPAGLAEEYAYPTLFRDVLKLPF